MLRERDIRLRACKSGGYCVEFDNVQVDVLSDVCGATVFSYLGKEELERLGALIAQELQEQDRSEAGRIERYLKQWEGET